MVFFCKVGINILIVDEKKWTCELIYYPYIYIITHGMAN